MPSISYSKTAGDGVTKRASKVENVVCGKDGQPRQRLISKFDDGKRYVCCCALSRRGGRQNDANGYRGCHCSGFGDVEPPQQA